jgi:hypothetical protein
MTSASRNLLAVGFALALTAPTLSAVDWRAFSAERTEENAGGGVHVQVGVDPVTCGFGTTYGVRLIQAPWVGCDCGGWLTYDADNDALFGAPLLTLWLIPQRFRLVPIFGFGGSYRFLIGNDDAETLVVNSPDGTVSTYDSRASSHWAVHAVGGFRLRFQNGQHLDLGAFWQRAILDLAPDEPANEIGIRLTLGYEW